MKLLFLGTGAANWRNGLEEKGEFLRRDSSALIDGELLIDPGVSVLEALETYVCDKTKIKYIINTHLHEDHFSKETVDELSKNGAVFVDFKAGEMKTLGKYTVSAYKGNHAATPTVHFLISDGEREVYYGLDGAWLMPDIFHELIDRRINAVILDGTQGFGERRGIFEHNNMGMIVEMAAVLNQYVDKVWISHISRKTHPDHETLVRDMAKYDVGVAYDGLEIEI